MPGGCQAFHRPSKQNPRGGSSEPSFCVSGIYLSGLQKNAAILRALPDEWIETMNNSKLTKCLVAVAAVLLSAGQTSAADISSKEKSFIKDALESSMAESKLGEVAQAKATRPEVKEFAKMMVEHHGKSNAELKKLADSKGVKYEEALGLRHSSAVDKLNKASSGAEFDKDFIEQMVSDHEKAVRDFEDAAKDVKDADVKAT